MDFDFNGRSPRDIFRILASGCIFAIISIRWTWEIIVFGHPLISSYDFIFMSIGFLLLKDVGES